MRASALVLALAAAASAAVAADVELDAQERDGQRIYLEAASPSGAAISARIGMGGLDLSGRTAACGNCHGEDGRGRAEGGIVPSNIVWSELTRPYGHRHADGRRHGPYDEQSLRRALLDGVDPDGNRLEGAMPRYSMSAKDLGALVAYLKKLERVLDPGLGEGSIRIGTLLPLTGPLAAMGESVRDLLSAHFAALNERGGIHGRRLELEVVPLPGDGPQARAATRRLLEQGRVFAVIAPFSVGVEAELSSAAAAAQVPVLGPLTLFPEDVHASNQLVFHVLPGVVELAQVLARHAAGEPGLADRPIALLHPPTAGGQATAEAVRARLTQAGWRDTPSRPLPSTASAPKLAGELRSLGVGAVLVLGTGGDIAALAREGARTGWTPQLLLPGPLAGREIFDLPAAFRDRVALAYPSSPTDQRSDALRDFAALGQGRAAARGHLPVQQAAYAASLLLVEGLKRTGRDLSRRKLVATLETVRGFDTGLVPPLSYNADRRIGAMGAYLVAVDLAQKRLVALGAYRRLP